MGLAYREEDGTWVAPALWKGDARPKATRREAEVVQERLYARMLQNEDIQVKYDQAIKDWVDKGYVRVIQQDEVEVRFFLPHFPVVREDKATTKVRVVLNGKYEYPGGSLKGTILAGPKVLNDLIEVLLRFRQWEVAFTVDVKEMFLRIKMREEDQPYHSFIHRFKGDTQFSLLQCTRQPFGSPGSPCTCIVLTKIGARDTCCVCPEACRAVLNDSIVDDVVTGAHTVADAARLGQELERVFGGMGMDLHKWATNRPDAFPHKATEGTKEVLDPEMEPDGPTQGALGLKWKTKVDTFCFKFQGSMPDPATKRTLLSTYMSLFDPLGWLLPTTMSGRLLLKEAWLSELGWDQALPEGQIKSWEQWFEDLWHLDRAQGLQPRGSHPTCLL